MFDRRTNLWILIWLCVLAVALCDDGALTGVFVLIGLIAGGALLSTEVGRNG